MDLPFLLEAVEDLPYHHLVAEVGLPYRQEEEVVHYLGEEVGLSQVEEVGLSQVEGVGLILEEGVGHYQVGLEELALEEEEDRFQGEEEDQIQEEEEDHHQVGEEVHFQEEEVELALVEEGVLNPVEGEGHHHQGVLEY